MVPHAGCWRGGSVNWTSALDPSIYRNARGPNIVPKKKPSEDAISANRPLTFGALVKIAPALDGERRRSELKVRYSGDPDIGVCGECGGT